MTFGNKQKAYGRHRNNCKEYVLNEIKVGNLVECKICGYTATKLALHLSQSHSLTKEEYMQQHNSEVIAKNTLDKYLACNKNNAKWFSRAKERGEDVSWFGEKVSKSVSASIMNNPAERERRAKLLGQLNKRDDFRKKSSDTAKKTSARKDIQEKRAGQLKRWRDGNRDDFIKKCIIPNMYKFQSLPERKLYEFVKNINNNFKRNQQLVSNIYFKTNKSSRKQVDIIDLENKIILEFDGECHFKMMHGDEHFEKIVKKDLELDEFCKDNIYILIRVSQSCFIYKTINDFRQDVKFKIEEILKNPKPGVFYLGAEYGSKNILESKDAAVCAVLEIK